MWSDTPSVMDWKAYETLVSERTATGGALVIDFAERIAELEAKFNAENTETL